MVKYDKKCGSCNHEFEVERSYTDTKPIKCPECGKSNRIVSVIKKSFPVLYRAKGFTKRVKKDV